jgi:hypothetical protein
MNLRILNLKEILENFNPRKRERGIKVVHKEPRKRY